MSTSSRARLAALALLALVAVPTVASAETPETTAAWRRVPRGAFDLFGDLPYRGAVPEGFHVEERMRKGLVLSGALTFGSFYVASAAVGVALYEDGTERDFARMHFVPVVGPFFAVPYLREHGGILAPFEVANGVFQALGVGLFVAGITSTTKVLVPGEARRRTAILGAPTFATLPGRGAQLGWAGAW